LKDPRPVPHAVRAAVAAILLAALALGVCTAAWGDLYNETDGQYAGAARVMAEGGSWLVPQNNGEPRLVKPPLLYWMLASSFRVFGVNEFAARIPNALALVAIVGAVMQIGFVRGGAAVGLRAGAILASSLGMFTLGRIIMPEPWFAAFIAWALAAVLSAKSDALRPGAAFAFWLASAGACLVKGWHGVLYPLAILGTLALFDPSVRSAWRSLFRPLPIAVFLALTLPWHIAMEAKFPGYFSTIFGREYLGHVLGTSAPATTYTNVPRWEFVALHVAWWFPWSLFFLAAVVRRNIPRDPLPWIWLGIVFASVLLTGQRQDYYAMAGWPAFALLVASAWPRRLPSVWLWSLGVGSLLLAGVALAARSQLLTRAVGPGTTLDRATAWTTLAHLGSTVWANLAFLAAAVLLLGGIAWCGAGFARPRLSRFACCAVAAWIFCLGAAAGMSSLAPFFSSAALARSLVEDLPTGAVVGYEGGLDTGSALLFYFARPVQYFDPQPAPDAAMVERCLSGQPTAVIIEAARIPEWSNAIGKRLRIARQAGTQVLVVNW